MTHKFSDKDIIEVENHFGGDDVILILNGDLDIRLNKSDIAMIAMSAGLVVYPKNSKVKCNGEK